MKKRSSRTQPPRWPLWLLRQLCPRDLFEMIEGDLLEHFEDDLVEFGEIGARRRFAWNAIKFLRPGILARQKRTFHFNHHDMLSHYIVSAFRQIVRNKVLVILNIIGLVVGMSAFFLIARYVSFETSFDNFHKNKDQIYRVSFHQYENDDLKLASARNFMGILSLALGHVPEVTAATAFDRTAEQAYFQFVYENKNYYQPGSFYQTDENFFKVFPSLLKKGDPNSVLSDPHNLVLSQKMATLIFGDEDPIGKKVDNRSYGYANIGTFVVTGVMIDVPENSHFHLNFIAKNSNDEVSPENFWTEPRFYIYLTLTAGAHPSLVSDKLNSLLKGLNAQYPKTSNVKLELQPITTIHNRSELSEELEPNGNESLLYLLGGIGIAVLVSAWINYMNIATGRFITRTKEIGVRKTLGSGISNLANQFFVEYSLVTIIAVGMATIALSLFVPAFNEFLNLPAFDYWSSSVWLASCGLFVVGALAMGIFLSVVFVRQRSRLIGIARAAGSHNSAPFRKALIAFQFICSTSLIAILMIVHNQTSFMMVTNKKIDIENIVSIRNPTVYTNEDSLNFVEYAAFQNEVTSNNMINKTTASSAIPGMEIEVAFTDRVKRNMGDPYDPTPYKILFIDYDYIPFYHLSLKAGRNYSIEGGDDKTWSTIIMNESAAHAMGFNNAEDAVDQEVYFHLFGDDFKKYKIIGIIEDYHHETAKKAIQPTILSLNHRQTPTAQIQFQQVFFSVKLNAGTNPQEALTFIEHSWKDLFPDKPFEFFFQDEYYDRQFKAERRFSSIFGLFTGVSTLIACLGIVGMTLFETTSRLKEVSIRKVLGASIVSLVTLLSANHMKIVLLSAVCCIPIIYYFSTRWLDRYPVKINVSVLFYLLPVAAIALLVALSCGWPTIRAAIANPIDQLKNE